MKHENVCVIVGAMPVPFLPAKRQGDFYIAADAGYESMKKCGITPDLIIGDFDSAKNKPYGENVEVFPKMKDDTDTMLAVKKALFLGFTRIHLYGGMGGRLDHTFANAITLSYIRHHGAIGVLAGDECSLTVLKAGDVLSFGKSKKELFSVFSLSETASVGLDGFLYSGDISLSRDFPLGVSNEFCGKNAVITVKSGEVLVVTEAELAEIC